MGSLKYLADSPAVPSFDSNREFTHYVLARRLYDSLGLPHNARFAIGYSGGLDSTALLFGLSRLMAEQPHRELLALHFNHAMHPAADEWQRHCVQTCQALDVPIICGKWSRSSGTKSDEGSARAARYEWFCQSVPLSYRLLLAHHRDDQIETVLMNLYEARGSHRVAGMLCRRPLAFGDRREIIRPLLSIPRTALLSYVGSNGLQWMEDPSNADPRHLRSRLRSGILPALRQSCPNIDAHVLQVASDLQRVNGLWNERIQRRLEQAMDRGRNRIFCGSPPLQMGYLMKLKRMDLEGVLRQWMHAGAQGSPGTRGMAVLLDELDARFRTRNELQKRKDLRFDWRGASIREYRGRLYLLGPLPSACTAIPWKETHLELVPGLHMYTESVADPRGGRVEELTWRWRTGGEKIRLPGRSHSTSLKKACQAFGIPEWERDCLPYLVSKEELVWFYGIGWCGSLSGVSSYPTTIDCSRMPRIRLVWKPKKPDRAGPVKGILEESL